MAFAALSAAAGETFDLVMLPRKLAYVDPGR